MQKSEQMPSAPLEDETEEFQLDTNLWPTQSGLKSPRLIYYRGNLTSDEVIELKHRGYNPVDIITLPRSTDEEQRLYLLAKAQAIEEGTIIASAEDRRQLALNMHAFGMLKSKDMSFDVRTNTGTTDVDAVLDWSKTRHTFKDNSTVDIVGRTPEELREESHKAVEDARLRAQSKIRQIKGDDDDGGGKKKKKKKKQTRRAQSTAKKPKLTKGR